MLERSGARNATRCSPTRSPISAGCRRRGLGSTRGPRATANAAHRAPAGLIGRHAYARNRRRARSAPGAGVVGTGTRRGVGRGTGPTCRRQRRGHGDARRRGCADVGVDPPHTGPAAARCSRRPRSPSRSARFWDGWSRPEPVRSTTSRPAFDGWGGSRSGRSSSPRAERWFRCCANAGVAAAPPAVRGRPSRCAGCRPWSTRGVATSWPTRCRAACWRSIRASTPGR